MGVDRVPDGLLVLLGGVAGGEQGLAGLAVADLADEGLGVDGAGPAHREVGDLGDVAVAGGQLLLQMVTVDWPLEHPGGASTLRFH